MFWRKKPEVKEAGEAKVEKAPRPTEMPEIVISEAAKRTDEKLTGPLQMPKMEIKGKEKAKPEKLPLPQEIPDVVRKFLVTEKKQDANWLRKFKAVVRRSPKGREAFDIRIFDDVRAAVKKVTVRDYTSLDGHEYLILYEGWFDREAKQVELEERAGLEVSLKTYQDVPIFTEAEIRQKIEALSVPGSTVFFYLAGSPAYGGPFGRGAAVVELNPSYPGKKQKKYIVYAADVDGLEPVGKGQKLFDSDNAKKIASYIKEAHHKPSY